MIMCIGDLWSNSVFATFKLIGALGILYLELLDPNSWSLRADLIFAL